MAEQTAPPQSFHTETSGTLRAAGSRGGGQRRRNNDRGEVEVKQYDERVVNIDRVARVVKGGRRFRFRALVIIGDHNGKVGMGISKGADVTAAVTKAVEVAKKNLIKMEIVNDTIAHEITTKIGGAKIMIKPASAGTGLIAGGVVRTILEVAGVKNALSKSLGSSSKINTSYATLSALQSIQHPDKWLTRRSRSAAKPAEKKAEPAEIKVTAKKPAAPKKGAKK